MYIIPPAKEAKTGQSWASLLASLVEMVCSRSSECLPTEPTTETEKWLRKHPYTQINESTNKNNRKIWKTFLLLSCWTQRQSPGQTDHLSPASHPLRYSTIKPTSPAIHSLNCALTECRCPKHWDFKTRLHLEVGLAREELKWGQKEPYSSSFNWFCNWYMWYARSNGPVCTHPEGIMYKSRKEATGEV